MKKFQSINIEPISFTTRLEHPDMGISTGLKSLDKMILGFHPARIYLVGAVPGLGKTSIMADFVIAAAKKAPVGVLSIEMGRQLFLERLVFNKADINYHKAKSGKTDMFEKQEIINAINYLNKLFIAIDGEADSFYPDWLLNKGETEYNDSIEYTINSWCQQGCKIIFIDYLQLADYKGKYDSEVYKVKEMSRKLCRLAVNNKIPIVVLSQLKKEVAEREDPTPRKSDIRDSGGPIQDASVIILLHRPEYYEKVRQKIVVPLFENHKERAEIIIAKNRYGPEGICEIDFYPYCMSYRDPKNLKDSEIENIEEF